MSHHYLTVSALSFQYPESTLPVLQGISFAATKGWTGIIGANGSGKTTLLRLVCGQLSLQQGSIIAPAPREYLEQEVSGPPPALSVFFDEFYAGDAWAGELFSRLELDHDWPWRWPSLSPGERKRAQIAAALLANPPLLSLDEPTNHLDEAGQEILLAGLAGYTGIGLVVSHDRSFLDRLCRSFLFLAPGSATLRHGRLADCLEQQQREHLAAQRNYQEARRQYLRLKDAAAARKQEAARHHHDFSKKGIKKSDHDAKGRVDAARASNKDTLGGKLYKTMANRADRALDSLNEIRRPTLRKTGTSLQAVDLARDFILLQPAGQLELGGGRQLNFPELQLAPGARASLTGANGSGKTSLLNHLVSRGALKASSWLYLPQEFSGSHQQRFLAEYSRLDDAERGRLLSEYSRLNGDPELAGDPSRLSPGELRKLVLAMGFCRQTGLIVLDEPTNHLDLPSRLALEEALAGFAGGLLVISHDPLFRRRLGGREWRIADGQLTVLN